MSQLLLDLSNPGRCAKAAAGPNVGYVHSVCNLTPHKLWQDQWQKAQQTCP